MDRRLNPDRYFFEQGRDGKFRLFDRMRNKPYTPLCECDNKEDSDFIREAIAIKLFADRIKAGEA